MVVSIRETLDVRKRKKLLPHSSTFLFYWIQPWFNFDSSSVACYTFCRFYIFDFVPIFNENYLFVLYILFDGTVLC